ncbi:pyridoxamine 5'-phosphate oxidase [Pseudobdellovibrio exovorus]|uniref:Pyridoxamine 5'-phosphate oxidase n=1 Tax=Pseudobdellovibrio exovorus JSS TaxID=1184267 RepID=M4VPU3_9BACT|nr:pyridoxamine 5'-phosphate oxidase [Pseudobdellovibrio exovorus]AGH95154.1 pyridoxamine 5'-phosphate oxidase [Pseudobdellovibrio exovorus JSS]
MSFDFKKDPIENFLSLYKQAQLKGIPDANAMSLATVNADNQPSVRIVFYKGISERGFSFFTNYNGRKGQDLAHNAKVAANFFWPHLEQQVRIEGHVEKLSREESEAYFASRPRLSQIGAWGSNQSEILESFDHFTQKVAALEEKFKGQLVPCPPHWGGYRIVPHEIEFWFGQTGRLHQRYVYQVDGQGWKRFLRSP